MDPLGGDAHTPVQERETVPGCNKQLGRLIGGVFEFLQSKEVFGQIVNANIECALRGTFGMLDNA